MFTVNPIDLGTTKLVEVPVYIDGKEYVLREASGSAVVEYRSARINATSFNEEGKTQAVRGSIVVTESLLVSHCLYLNDEPVPQSTLLAWPARIVRALYDKVLEISEINEPAKKDEGTTEDPNPTQPNGFNEN